MLWAKPPEVEQIGRREPLELTAVKHGRYTIMAQRAPVVLFRRSFARIRFILFPLVTLPLHFAGVK